MQIVLWNFFWNKFLGTRKWLHKIIRLTSENVTFPQSSKSNKLNSSKAQLNHHPLRLIVFKTLSILWGLYSLLGHRKWSPLSITSYSYVLVIYRTGDEDTQGGWHCHMTSSSKETQKDSIILITVNNFAVRFKCKNYYKRKIPTFYVCPSFAE